MAIHRALEKGFSFGVNSLLGSSAAGYWGGSARFSDMKFTDEDILAYQRGEVTRQKAEARRGLPQRVCQGSPMSYFASRREGINVSGSVGYTHLPTYELENRRDLGQRRLWCNPRGHRSWAI